MATWVKTLYTLQHLKYLHTLRLNYIMIFFVTVTSQCPYPHFLWKCSSRVKFGCLPSAVRNFTKTSSFCGFSTWRLQFMRQLHNGLYASKFATSWIFLEVFLNRWKQVDLCDFKRQERICTRVKHNTELFLQVVRLLYPTFTKTAIKSK